MQRTCSNGWCKASFEITEDDLRFLSKFDVPEPTKCSNCRHQLRGIFRGWVYFHKRTSDLSGKAIVSLIHPKRPYCVYAIDEWWSDQWDAEEYGRDIDFSRPFFPQFEALYNVAPKMANFVEGCENCDYCAYAGSAKNGYYSHRVFRSQDVYYSEAVTSYSSDVCDGFRCFQSSWLYECVQCFRCHNSIYLFRCSDTRDCHYCIDCRGCTDCLFCNNLRNKSYHILNEPVSKEEFQKVKASTIDGRYSTQKSSWEKYRTVYTKTLWPATFQLNCENCVGDMLMNCANCYETYDCFNCEDMRHCWDLSPSEKNVGSMDVTNGGIAELLYNCAGVGGRNYFLRMCSLCRNCSYFTYCIDCFDSKNCFGCTGLKKKEHCILNKQYTKIEYEKLVAKLIAHMRTTKEWGEFFPFTTSPFAYNESMSMKYFPLDRPEILKRGWQWEDELRQEVDGTAEVTSSPDSIDKVTGDICEKSLTCTSSKRKYRIIPQELAFYRRMHVPLPRLHPDLRMEKRRSMLNPYHLYTRTCKKCGKSILTSFPPNRPEIVYCEACYLQTVY